MKRKLINVAIATMSMAVICATFTGCEGINLTLSRLRGQLIGNKFDVVITDNNANKVIEMSGKKVDVSGLSDKAGEQTSYIDITIDGGEVMTVGNTVIFEERGLDKVAEFFENEQRETNVKGTGLIPIDRYINNVKGFIGKERIVVVESQLGVPIAVYQGSSVSMSIPDDLPKMTLVSIDGKALYIHRANVTILDTKLLK